MTLLIESGGMDLIYLGFRRGDRMDKMDRARDVIESDRRSIATEIGMNGNSRLITLTVEIFKDY
jgi:hypothetical protein